MLWNDSACVLAVVIPSTLSLALLISLSLCWRRAQLISKVLTIRFPWCAWGRRRGRRSLLRSRGCRRMRFPWLSWLRRPCRIGSDRATHRVHHGRRLRSKGSGRPWREPKQIEKIIRACRERARLLTVTVFLYFGSSQFSARMQRRASLRSRALQTSLRPLTSPIIKEKFQI